MNIESEISPELWAEIQSHYEAQQYPEAIRDALSLVTRILRDKADLPEDGEALVKGALGGVTPRVKITALESQADRDIQSGTEALARGLFQSNRGPGMPAAGADAKTDADRVIVFIDYIGAVLGRARPRFSVADFLPLVFDPNFAADARYADLLVAEIPEKSRWDTYVEVYRRKEEGDLKRLSLFLRALMVALPFAQQEDALGLISGELRATGSERTVRTIIQLLDPSYWARVHPAARLRVENWMIESIREGSCVPHTKQVIAGAFGTWITRLYPSLELKKEAAAAIVARACAEDRNARFYALYFFLERFSDLVPEPIETLLAQFRKELPAGNDVALAFAKQLAARCPQWTEVLADLIVGFHPPAQDQEVPF
jgi:hypothetical protein